MAKRTTSPDKILLDPLFTVPEGAEEVFTKDREQSDIDIETVDIESVADDFGDDSYEEGDYQDIGGGDDLGEFIVLETPDEFAIIDQRLRRAPGGQIVVDIVLQVEDIDGATNYEVQVTKV